MKKDINSRADGITKDIVPQEESVQTFTIPSLGISVEAKSMNEALEKAKEVIKSNN
ncbi:hypothetical protein [Tsuneonella sp. HG222]